ncbi:hypothetical protein JOC34_000550 [Virgibacillus halotolerans]|uniref:hypothetical protein n=1 Tax=Virgibacillus halotolerans TaxID=1071053 RepID=UPI00195FDABF|nr:hypothetical protein [Virgibacillus halotolerans]MBM7598193.1 hypothetical protein [Virgibacillus halotolerans]
MKAILLEDYNSGINDYFYKRGQDVDITELKSFEDSYAVYRYGGLDWIPKSIVKIID